MPIGSGGVGSGTVVFNGCKAYNSNVQSINSGSLTTLTFDSEEYDTAAFHSIASNTSRITIPTGLPGYYLFTFSGFWAAAPGTSNHACFLKNGTTLLRAGGGFAPNNAGYAGAIATTAQLVVTDFVEVQVIQNSGGAINIGSAAVLDAQSAFTATYLGPT